MKLDKDTLLKHKFWVVLALAVPLAIVGLVLLSTSVTSVIAKEQKSIDTALKNVKIFNDPKSREWVDLAAKIAADREKDKDKVWEAAASQQKKLMQWPKFIEDTYHFQDGLFAREITATRKTEDPKAAASGAKDDKNPGHGTITVVDQDSITVVGNGQKESVFRRTPGVKVQIIADPPVDRPTFDNLKKGDRVNVVFERGKYFGDKLTEKERIHYAREYQSQLREIIDQVNPMNDKGEGVVQFPDWTWKADKPHELPPEGAKFFRYVAGEWKADYDFSDEAWIAQEDLWIQREIYRLVAAANNSLARMDREEVDKKYVFKNTYWQLGCNVTTARKLKVTIKNLLNVRQDLDVTFLMTQKDHRTPVRVRVEGVARGPVGTSDSKGAAGDTLEVTFDAATLGIKQDVVAVEQVLTWKTAAVKRIDNISMGSIAPDDCSLSQRLVSRTLVPYRKEEVKVDPTAAPAPPPGGQPTGPVLKLTPNKLIRDRYLEKTEQARRVPVAVVLIVDQQQVERVLTAFTDSNLRFLLTQVVMNRYPVSMRPQEAADPSATTPGTPMAPVRPRRPTFVRGPRGGPNPAPAPTETAASSSEEESNIELVLYGIVSLYERYPPRTAAVTLAQ